MRTAVACAVATGALVAVPALGQDALWPQIRRLNPEKPEYEIARAVAFIDVFGDGGERVEQVAGILIDATTIAAPWWALEDRSTITVTFGCCDKAVVHGVVGADAAAETILLKADPPAAWARPATLNVTPPAAGEEVRSFWSVRIEGYATAMTKPFPVLGVRAYAGDSVRFVLADDNPLVMRGSVCVDAEERVLGMLVMPPALGSAEYVPCAPIAAIERHDPIPLDVYSNREPPPGELSRRLWRYGAHKRSLGNAPEGRRLLERAAALDDRNWRAWYLLGVCIDEGGDAEAADAPLARSIEIEPAYIESRYSHGIVCLKLGRLDDAVSSFLGALALDAEHAKSHGMLGAAYLNKGDLENALDSMERAVRLGPDEESHTQNLEVAYQRAGADDRRLAFFEELVATKPDSPNARLGRARSLFDAGRLDEALEPLRRAVAVAPDDTRLRLMLVICLGEKELFKEALAQVDEVLKREPGHPQATEARDVIISELERTKKGGG